MKMFKSILKYILLLILILFFSGFIFTYFFGEKVEQIILNKLNSKLKTEILNSDIDFSLYKNFPYASVQLNDVLILSSFEGPNDTLLFAKQISVNLNIIDIISKKYNIESIIFESGIINIKYDSNGIGNFNILRDSERKKIDFEIDMIKIENSDFQYTNYITEISMKHKILSLNH